MHLVLGSKRLLPVLPGVAPPPWPHARAQPLLYAGGEGDAKRCPFFGGNNGGGIGDANLATALVFLLSVLLLRLLLMNAAIVLRPRRILTSAMLLLHSLRGAVAI